MSNPESMTEGEIREAVKIAAGRQFANDPDTLVIEEMFVDGYAARVDVAVINGALHGYEIKSARDTLQRLPGQVESYGRVFDAMTLVVAERHLADAQALVPDWWAIAVPAEAPSGPELHELRSSGPNPGVDALALAQLLWRDEAIAVLEQKDVARGLRGSPMGHALSAVLHLDRTSGVENRQGSSS